MDEIVKSFVEASSLELLDKCTKDQLSKIAQHYKIDVRDKKVKQSVKLNLKSNLLRLNVFGAVISADGEDS